MLNVRGRVRAWPLWLSCAAIAAVAAAALPVAADVASSDALAAWPEARVPPPRDEALEARIASIVAGMSLRDKVAQMTQSEIGTTTPDDVREYRLGSVLNGGGSWPGRNRRASVQDWLALSQAYYDASLATGAKVRVPIIWGIDAVHGNNNVRGATLFPHNIGLGAARDPELIEQIGAAVGKAVRATGIQWVFAPTVAVVQDSRWGRTYESFGEDPALVQAYAGAYVRGLQGDLRGDGSVIATAKHYLGDGGTTHGKDQGVTEVPMSTLAGVHARGYYAALAAGVQTVMPSYSSYTDTATGTVYGKMHGNGLLLTQVLKERLGFDGFVISDWDAIGQLPGCTNSSCPAAINAGVDMVMVPNDWKAFIDNTVAQVERGEIPQARIDDAVARILRVKLRAGVFDRAPRQGRFAGDATAIEAHDLARRAVRESLVLLKNDGAALPLARGQRILVVGRTADFLPAKAGGWSVTWQGDQTDNADFPNADTLLAAVRDANAVGAVTYSKDARGVDVSKFDAVIAVLGEAPYAEFKGDVTFPAPLGHAVRYPEDAKVLRAVAGKGVPVVTILLTGRVQYATDLLNLSDAFVVAWLPGTEGKGVTDVLFRGPGGAAAVDFRGRLPFAWPASPCRTAAGTEGVLFPYGYGLSYAAPATTGPLAEAPEVRKCGTP